MQDLFMNHSAYLARFIPFLSYFPLVIFMMVVRIKNLLNDQSDSLEWATPFLYASLVAVVVIVLHVIFKADLNRFLLAINLWLIACALLFLCNNVKLLNLMDDYKGPFFFISFIITGIISMLFLKGGFIDLKHITHEKNNRLSLFLLSGCVIALIWSLIFNSAGFILSIVVPFAALRIFYAILIKRS
jgi:hypothetical protein